MRAGELRETITFQQIDPIRDAFNAVVDNWIDVLTTRAKVETLSGTEYIAQQAAGASLSHKITLRRQTGVTPDMRVKWRDRYLDIQAVLDDQRESITLMCSEVV
jgi:SPP1 family predicted phage head-tail adaptor